MSMITSTVTGFNQRFQKVSENELDQEIQEIVNLPILEHDSVIIRDLKIPIRVLTVSGIGAVSSCITVMLSNDLSVKVAGYVTSAGFGALFCGTCYQLFCKKC